MSMLLDDFKGTKRDLKRIYSLIEDEFNEIEEENNTGNNPQHSKVNHCRNQADQTNQFEI